MDSNTKTKNKLSLVKIIKTKHNFEKFILFLFDLYYTHSFHNKKKNIAISAACPDHQPPFPLFFFFCCCFFFVAAAPGGFWCLGGIMLLVDADGMAVIVPGRGDVGGLLAVLLASLQKKNNKDNC